MNTLTETIHFSKPYIRRYWPRFVMGVVLGLLFGLSNGLIAGALYMVSNRVTDPNAVQYTVTQGEEAKAQASAAREEKANEPEDPTVKALKVRGATLKQEIYLTLDPWLPLKGRALDWKQVLGGLLILPLFVALRGLLGYGSSYLLAWSGLRITNDVKTDAFRKISSLSLDYFQKTTTQELIARIEADGASLNNFLRMGMSDLVKEPSTIVCLLISMLIFNCKGAERSAYYSLKTIQSREMLNPIVQVFSTFAITLVLLYAFWTNTNAATIAAFLLSLGLFGASVKKINVIGVYWNQLSVSLDRLLALFALQPSVKESPNALPMAAFSRSIDVRNVTFSYGDAPVLQDISFSLARGQRLGLAGESGSGKSSLINLLFRFYDPTSGRIEIDGVPITDLRIADLRFHLALVSQDILLFNATVAENIAFGKIGATRDEVIAAAREAYAHDFIEALPQGYDTPLGERGQRLSGGQRQRIAIARAFVRNAPILVLDEATASLDSQAEAEVQGAIDHLAENRTVICVAHRLSTLRGMDRILVLEKGRIVEQGTFDQLLAQRGIFTAMAARQSIFPQAA
jgi:ABC-type multidrug transport system fused ATPase/permease subunit